MKSTPLTMALSLTSLCLLAGTALAGVRMLTERPIAQAAEKARAEALKAVLPTFDNNPMAEATEADGLNIYPATLAGTPVGAAIETYSDAGFSGRITLLVGFRSDGAVSGFSVLSHSETPGLGARMDRWFRSTDNDNSHNITGTSSLLAVRQDGGDIDAITGATITSRAFTEAVNRARKAYTSSQSGKK